MLLNTIKFQRNFPFGPLDSGR